MYCLYTHLILYTYVYVYIYKKNKAYGLAGNMDPGFQVFRISVPPPGLLEIRAEILRQKWHDQLVQSCCSAATM